MISKSFSFKGWDVWHFIKGRKKMVVTVVASLIGLLIYDSATAMVVSGGLVESGFALAEYFFKRINNV
ncbi:hypothetical protein LCGC14_2632610 [marine sediment metagenome]|uniref:Uncharacterized protein n=1 Tax=marine sediment metagenome TaxID=412755 RepID=A0A0F8ZZQ2_9ZZZZ